MEAWQVDRRNSLDLIRLTSCTTDFLTHFYQQGMLSEEDMDILEKINGRSRQVRRFYEIIKTRSQSFDLLIAALLDTSQSGAHDILNADNGELIEAGSIRYWKTRVIGSGCYGTKIYMGTFASCDVAVKVINTLLMDLNRARREAQFLENLGPHENIVKYLKTEETENYVLIALELCNTNLHEWVSNPNCIEMEISVEEVVLQATKGVNYLHSRRIIHGDLKPSNILIHCRLECGGVLVKISDFGMSKIIPSENSGVTTVSINPATAAMHVWSAPEVLRHLGRGSQTSRPRVNRNADIFSLGCIIYFVLTGGLHPFGEEGLIISGGNILKGKFSLRQDKITLSHTVALGYISLIEVMIDKKDKKRPSASEVLSCLLDLQKLCEANGKEEAEHLDNRNSETIHSSLGINTDDKQDTRPSTEGETTTRKRIKRKRSMENTGHQTEEAIYSEPPGLENEPSADTKKDDQASSSPQNENPNSRGSSLRKLKITMIVILMAIIVIFLLQLVSKLFVPQSRVGNHRDPFGNTLLHNVARDQNEEMASVNKLILFGSNVNARNRFLETPLIAAVNGKDTLVSLCNIKLLIDHGADVYLSDRENLTFHHYLVTNGSLFTPSQLHDIAKYLITKDLTPLFNLHGGYSGLNPFQLAVRNIEVEKRTLELLKLNGVNFDVTSRSHWNSILFYALQGGRSTRLLSDLISMGASLQHKNKFDQGLLHSAAGMGHFEGVKFFIRKGLDVNSIMAFLHTPLHRAVEVGKENVAEIVEILIKNGAYARSENKRGEFPLDIVLGRNDLLEKDKVAQLLRCSRRDKKDKYGNTQLHNATSFQNEEVVKRLVQSGADLNEQNDKLQTPLIVASLGNDKMISLRIIKFLIDSGADASLKSRGGRTFLHCLISIGSPLTPSQFHDLAKYLISKNLANLFNLRGGNPSFQGLHNVSDGTSGSTPILEAVNHIEILSKTLTLLHNNGVNFRATSKIKSNSILAHALARGRSIRLISELVSLGVTVGHVNRSDRTLLHIAAEFSRLDGVNYFIANFSPNQLDCKGNTALHRVVKWGKKDVLEIVRVLIKYGANVNIRNTKRKSAFDIALSRNDLVGKDKILDLLT